MVAQVLVMVGTKKGAFVLESSAARTEWDVRGPYLEGQNVMHMAFDPRTQVMFAAVGDPWFGSRIHRSHDLGRTWDEPRSAPVFPADTGLKVEKIWNVTPGRAAEPGVVYAGVEPAALFKSSDGGDSWTFIQSLNEHPSRPFWNPGAGGLCLHTIILDPVDLDRIYIAISSAGLFRTTDGGATWQAANQGTRANFMPDDPPSYPEFGQCVHKVALNPAQPMRLYQQNHCGVYRSDDGADSWLEVTGDLPSEWGLGLAINQNNPDMIWICPGTSSYKHWVPDGQMAVHRSSDQGATWTRLTTGLPDGAFVNVLRDAMASDALQPAGVYVGTNTGQLFHSADEGDSWRQSPTLFPGINSVATAAR